MSLERRNAYEEFQDEYGDFTNYRMNRGDVLDGFYRAFHEEEEREELLLIEEKQRFEQDLYEMLGGGGSGIIAALLSAATSSRDYSDDYAEFMQDFEVEEADENMLYWCRYDP